jgi:hypothetical protein
LLSAALASLTVRLHEGGSETRKVEAVALNERIVYGEAAAGLFGRSAVDAEALQRRRMGQSPEKPKGYGTEVLPHRRSLQLPLRAAAAEEVSYERERRRRRSRRRM